MRAVLENLSPETANLYGLILASQKIPYGFHRHPDGWDLLSEDEDVETALRLITLYTLENQPIPEAPPSVAETAHPPIPWGGFLISTILCLIQVLLSSGTYKEMIVDHYGASSQSILNGEIFRCVTALFLHADAAHLAGNIAGLTVFGTLAIRLYGSGLGLFGILCTGALGNALNAVLFHSHSLSIGASTSVFGAVGILSGHRSVRQYRESGPGFKALAPIGAGAALLAFLGTSPHSDLMAHLLGFLVGFFFGALPDSMERNRSHLVQTAYLLATVLIVAVSWYRF